MRILHVDIETRCEVDLTKCGVYKYARHKSFEILWLANSYDDEPVKKMNVWKEGISQQMKKDLQDPSIIKYAHNAAFEIECLSQYLGVELDVTQWRCTMVMASMCGLPGSLDKLSEVLKLQNKKQKIGFSLILKFSVKQKATLRSGVITKPAYWINPEDDPEAFELFGDYCVDDVYAEIEVLHKLSWFQIPYREQIIWFLDQKINRRGVLIDLEFVNAAIKMFETTMQALGEKQKELTHLLNPKSPKQLKEWVENQIGEDLENFNKQTVNDLLKSTVSATVRQVLNLRKEMSKTSIKKYHAMLQGVCDDGRVRGLLQYYGANRTGRWAGRFVQIQNLPKPPGKKVIPDPVLPRDLVIEGRADFINMLFGNVSNILSWLIRTAFIAPKGKRFIVTDFAAIEARVIAWLANEKWRLEVFDKGEDIYIASAAAMFHIPMASIAKDGKERQQGKVAELALGFQGGVDALKRMDYNKSIPEDQYQGIVDAWRAASPAIVQLWKDVQNAAFECIETGCKIKLHNGLIFRYVKRALLITLPSGRELVYINAHLKEVKTKFGPKLQIHYLGVNQETKKLEYITTYGGKLVENIVQGTARDLLAGKMLQATDVGYDICFHVHDEIVSECSYGFGSIDEINKIMSSPLPWTNGLPLSAASFETEFYYKD